MAPPLPFQYTTVRNKLGKSFIMPPYITQTVINVIQNRFELRDDDVFLVTYPKSGTHWLKQIIHLLIHGGQQPNLTTESSVPFLEIEAAELGLYGLAELEKLTSRRYFHTHLPLSLLPRQDDKTKYIYLARDPRDCAVSYYHFSKKYKRMKFSGEWDEFFELYISGQVQYGSVFEHQTTWWQAGLQANNIFLLTYEQMHRNLSNIIAQVAEFLNLPLTPSILKTVIEQSTFKAMSGNLLANGQWIAKQDKFSLLRKGVVGDWQNQFSAAQKERFFKVYHEKSQEKDPYYGEYLGQ